MRKTFKPFLILLALVAVISCKKDAAPAQDEVSQDVLAKVYALGFSSQNVLKSDGGYIVEGDIFLSDADLNSTPAMQFLRVGSEEQYRTFNLVSALPRTITVSISDRLLATVAWGWPPMALEFTFTWL